MFRNNLIVCIVAVCRMSLELGRLEILLTIFDHKLSRN